MSKSNITPESIAVLEGMRDRIGRPFEPLTDKECDERRAIQAALDLVDKVGRFEKMLAAVEAYLNDPHALEGAAIATSTAVRYCNLRDAFEALNDKEGDK